MKETAHTHAAEEDKAHLALGLAIIGIIEFLFGLCIGWLIWG